MFSRRFFLGASGAAATFAMLGMPRMAFARADTAKRFVFIIQRGAADGLHVVAPTGDPAYASVRGDFAADFDHGTKLGSFFTLHPALGETAKLYQAKQALFVHAVASPYRDRSHFDGQNVLETGGSAAYRVKDGWINRLIGLLRPEDAKALALSSTVPMALRGPHEVSSYAPSALPGASDDLLTRVGKLYESDQQLHGLWSAAMETRMTAGDLAAGTAQNGAATGALAAKLLTGENGARLAMIETGGWDTHSGQRGRLNAQLRGLDQMVGALKTGLGPLWDDTVVLVATEFGRTVRVNGTQGTDHGTASCAMLMGGAVNGGRVLADWPGLADGALYENRDLKPTTGLDTVIGSTVSAHFGLVPQTATRKLFPEVQMARPLQDLLRA